MPIIMIIHLERHGISFSSLAHYKGEALGRAGWERNGLQLFFPLQETEAGWGWLSWLSLGFVSLWGWPPFPVMVIVLEHSGGPPSAGRHFSSHSSTLNSCWEQLGLCDCCQWETKWQMWVRWASLKGSCGQIVQDSTKVCWQGSPGKAYFNSF